MAPSNILAASALVGLVLRAHSKSICRPGDESEGGCNADGTGCNGETVEFTPYQMNVSTWDNVTKTHKKTGEMTSYYILGKRDTWQMYLHGPHIHYKERTDPADTSMPPVYVYATFTDQVYRFENFSELASGSAAPMKATQKIVGHALAPSTGYIIESQDNNRVQGLLIAEGEPFYAANLSSMHQDEVYAGGVEYLQSGVQHGVGSVCPQIFPTDSHKSMGEVVNTIDCHGALGVCFFTVWVFYDDQFPVWNKFTEWTNAKDCLHYCIMRDDWKTDQPTCVKTEIVKYPDGTPVCHKDHVGAVHGMTVGNTHKDDPTKFDILLVFTGKAKMDNGESSMKKLTVQKVNGDLKTLTSKPYAVDLFTKYPPKGWDVGGDHAWVDATGKYVWVSCFRQKGVGAHMLDYETGDLLYSVTGLDTLVPNQYTYTAGIHGIGTLGRKGSYLVIATSSCHDVNVCIPTVPWTKPVPEDWWTTAPFIIVDLASMTQAVAASVLV